MSGQTVVSSMKSACAKFEGMLPQKNLKFNKRTILQSKNTE